MTQIIYNYIPNKITQKLINIICKKVMNSKLKHNYNFSLHTQKYILKIVITKIFYVLYQSKNWRQLGHGWNNIYKHYIKLNKLHIFENTYLDLLKTYLIKNKRSMKIVSIDTSIVYNKYGIDGLKRNKYAKNKKCYKLFTLIDSKGKVVYFSYHFGNINDGKILNLNFNNILNIINNKAKYFLADSGFCSKKIRDKLNSKNIKPLIPKNIRNKKKDFKMKNLTFQERIKIMLEDFTKEHKIIYKKRIKVENVYANYKQINRFNMRYDKYMNSLIEFMFIYFSKLLI